MGLGPYFYLAWFVLVALALLVSVLHLVKKGWRGLGHATATILGALLSWAFISAYIGAVEIPGYTGTVAFAVSLLLGAAGLALLAASCLKLRKPPDA